MCFLLLFLFKYVHPFYCIIDYRYRFVLRVSEYYKMLLFFFFFLQKEYKKDLESKIKGKGMQVGTDTLEIQHAKKASEIASQVSRVNGAEALKPVFRNFTNLINDLISTWNPPELCD